MILSLKKIFLLRLDPVKNWGKEWCLPLGWDALERNTDMV